MFQEMRKTFLTEVSDGFLKIFQYSLPSIEDPFFSQHKVIDVKFGDQGGHSPFKFIQIV